MRIALLNLSNNITNFKTVSSGETIYIKKVLEILEHKVDIISKTSGEYTKAFEEVENINWYDKLLVINGAINFFGGKENPIIINNYKLMAKFKKGIDYLLTDLRLPFKQLWPAIEKRDWGYTKEDVWVYSDVRIISQSHNINMIKEMMPDLPVVYFPLERYILLFPNEYTPPLIKETDVIYGGSFRSGNRLKKMMKYFFDTRYEVELFGNIKESQFNHMQYQNAPKFTGKVPMSDIIEKNSTAYATLIIGDNNYDGNMLTLRVWEALLSDAVILIDDDFDPEHKIMGEDWFYVKNKVDVAIKVEYLKMRDKTRQNIINYQHKRIKEIFDEREYLERLDEII